MDTPTSTLDRDARRAVLPRETRKVITRHPLPAEVEQRLVDRYINKGTPPSKRLPAIWMLKERGWSVKKISETLDLTLGQVNGVIQKARERGHLAPIEKQFEHSIAQLAADTIQKTLEEGDPDVAPDMAIVVAKGLGHLKSHQAIKAESTHEGTMVLGLRLEVPEGATPRPIGAGTTIAGTPRTLTPGVTDGELHGSGDESRDRSDGAADVGEPSAEGTS